MQGPYSQTAPLTQMIKPSQAHVASVAFRHGSTRHKHDPLAVKLEVGTAPRTCTHPIAIAPCGCARDMHALAGLFLLHTPPHCAPCLCSVLVCHHPQSARYSIDRSTLDLDFFRKGQVQPLGS